ncbi:sulfur carrier protein ThiS adenylyltransferase ThiF [Desulfovibrio sp. JC022]|uniref:sulfur carrier protein ThiS adenylyltransferase ThiF n=1 Tax=Desulfovibrio sp. JC022 TaxID=2593642 RepID=UPI0013D19D41|nr:sulfur carrier protein ThiS adenylyltransferase ThiF [Desulfovibrio sp. JC022]
MNRTEQGIAKYLGKDCLHNLQAVRIGIAGAGGLGSNCAMHLVRSGFKKFIIADFDRIEESNLNRQFYFADQVGKSKVEALSDNLRAINPDLDITAHVTSIHRENVHELFGDCDVIIEAFDDAAAKKTLVETFLSTGKLLVTASGMGGTGNTDEIKTRKVRDNFYIIGDMKTECNAETPPFSPRVAICAAKQADIVLEHYLNKFQEAQ